MKKIFARNFCSPVLSFYPPAKPFSTADPPAGFRTLAGEQHRNEHLKSRIRSPLFRVGNLPGAGNLNSID